MKKNKLLIGLALILSMVFNVVSSQEFVVSANTDFIEIINEPSLDTQLSKHSLGYGINDKIGLQIRKGKKLYVSAIRVDASNNFLLNHCIEMTVNGHGEGFTLDDLSGEIQFLYYLLGLNKPVTDLTIFANRIKELLGVDTLYDDNLLEHYNDHVTIYGDDLYKGFLSYTGLQKEEYAAYMSNMGINNYIDYFEFYIAQEILQAVVWSITNPQDIGEINNPRMKFDNSTIKYIDLIDDSVIVNAINFLLNETTNKSEFSITPKQFNIELLESTDTFDKYKVYAIGNDNNPNTNWNSLNISIERDNEADLEHVLNLVSGEDYAELTVDKDPSGKGYRIIGDSFNVSTWFGRTTDGLEAGNPNHTQDHSFIFHNKLAKANLKYEVKDKSPSVKKVSVGDYVWLDVNKDGLQDETDIPLKGVVLNLTDEAGHPVIDVNGNLVDSVTTDENGFYIFENLPAGKKYVVTIDQEASKDALEGLVPTLIHAGDDHLIDSSLWSEISILLEQDGEHDPTLDFGFVVQIKDIEDPATSEEIPDVSDDSNEENAGVTNDSSEDLGAVLGDKIESSKEDESLPESGFVLGEKIETLKEDKLPKTGAPNHMLYLGSLFIGAGLTFWIKSRKESIIN